MQHRAFVAIGGLIFALVSLAHLARLILAWSIVIGPYTVPVWISIGGVLVPGMLAIWAGVLTLGEDEAS